MSLLPGVKFGLSDFTISKLVPLLAGLLRSVVLLRLLSGLLANAAATSRRFSRTMSLKYLSVSACGLVVVLAAIYRFTF